MKLTSAALAAICLLGSQSARAANYLFHDYGTGLAGLGVVPAPGEGYTPYWGGNLTTWGGPFFGPRGSTDVFANGVVHAEVLTLDNDEDLNPAGYQSSGLLAFGQNDDASYSVAGFVSGTCSTACTSGPLHAAYWVYPGGSQTTWVFTDLHPAAYTASLAQGTNGAVQVGWGQDSANVYHPLVWQGTAASAALLPLPGALTQGAAAAVASNKSALAVGWGNGADNAVHPLAWTPAGGTYAATDLLPAGATFGVAVATDNNYIGGTVITPSSAGQFHAAYWDGATASTFTDINPPPHGNLTYLASSVYSVTVKTASHTVYMAGLAVVDNRSRTGHAMLWVGPKFKPIDLQKVIGSGFVESVATGVDLGGNVSGSALDTSGVWHKVYWSFDGP
jgi:hypothetical protein